jgi:hypothetical protein
MARNRYDRTYEVFLVDRATGGERIWDYAGTLPDMGKTVHDWRLQYRDCFDIRIFGHKPDGGKVDLTQVVLNALSD